MDDMGHGRRQRGARGSGHWAVRVRRVVWLGLLGVGLACPTLGAEEFKVGYVSVGKVFDGYERTKLSDATLEKQGKQKEGELEGRLNELKKLRQNLELLSNEAREAKTKEVEEKTDELQRFRAGTARDLRRERDKIATEILQEIQQAVEEYAKGNGYSLILDGRSLLYGQSAQDVTGEVLKLLNSRYAKKP